MQLDQLQSHIWGLRKGFLIYEEMRKYLTIFEEAVSHIWLCNCSIMSFLIYEEKFIFFFISVPSSPYASEFASISQKPDHLYLTFKVFFNYACLVHRTAALYSRTEQNTNILLIIIYFREQILNSRDTSRIPILVIGNKSDLLLDFSTERNRLRYPVPI